MLGKLKRTRTITSSKMSKDWKGAEVWAEQYETTIETSVFNNTGGELAIVQNNLFAFLIAESIDPSPKKGRDVESVIAGLYKYKGPFETAAKELYHSMIDEIRKSSIDERQEVKYIRTDADINGGLILKLEVIKW